jgi:hypothetical protein
VKFSDPDAGRGDHRSRSGISVQTLIIASLASAAASYAVARIWGPGTLLGAAAAPVIVALVSETLRRPMRTVTATAKRVPTTHILPIRHVHDAAASAEPADVNEDPTRLARTRTRGAADPVATPSAAPSDADPGPIAHADAAIWRPRWWLAVVTGLIAFVIVIGVYTVPDLLAGRSITGNGQPTTFFGGSSRSNKKKSPTTIFRPTTSATVTKTAPATTTTKTTTSTATSTATSTTPATTTTTAPTTGTAPAVVSSTTTPTTPVP